MLKKTKINVSVLKPTKERCHVLVIKKKRLLPNTPGIFTTMYTRYTRALWEQENRHKIVNDSIKVKHIKDSLLHWFWKFENVELQLNYNKLGYNDNPVLTSMKKGSGWYNVKYIAENCIV